MVIEHRSGTDSHVVSQPSLALPFMNHDERNGRNSIVYLDMSRQFFFDFAIEYGIFGEGSQICVIACGGRVTNHNFWREKGQKFHFFDSELLAGEGLNWRFYPPPPKSCRLIFRIKGPEQKRFLIRRKLDEKQK